MHRTHNPSARISSICHPGKWNLATVSSQRTCGERGELLEGVPPDFLKRGFSEQETWRNEFDFSAEWPISQSVRDQLID